MLTDTLPLKVSARLQDVVLMVQMTFGACHRMSGGFRLVAALREKHIDEDRSFVECP
jgi:hypothetical protein